VESINKPELVKEHNLNLVREQLFKVRRATRQQLSALTGISNVTMGTLLRQLLETGEVMEAEKFQPTSGRPARIYYYNPRQRYGLLVSVGFESGGYRFHAALTNLYGEIVWEECLPAACLDQDATRRYFNRLLQIRKPVSAVSIGLPAVGFGEYLHKGNTPEYLSLEALGELERETNIPFHVENDVNLAAVGYVKCHRVGSGETLAYLFLMQGAYGGSAVYIDGKLHLGKGRFAGEFLPAPYGPNWSRMKPEPAGQLTDALFTAILPYLTILAPHRLIIASDYIQKSHLDEMKRRTISLFGERQCPKFALTEDFRKDYREGLKQLVVEQITDPIGRRNHT